ncbi:MAG: sugar nucleotide-binding protein [Planctomycetes bacterium]|nr:sugar nucleotide-binding protein [Planctomycetota bacterium]
MAGVYHLCANDSTTWHGFASEAVSLMARYAPKGQFRLDSPEKVRAIDSKDFPAKVVRPEYSVLNCGKSKKILGLSLPDWRFQLDCCLNERWITP